MSEETEIKPKSGKLAAITTEDVASIVAAALNAQAEKNAAQTDKLVDAILESRKPWVDPRTVENENMFRENTRRQEAKNKAMEKASHDACPHLQGCNPLGNYAGSLTAIAWHRLDTGVVWGICTVCQRQFWPTDPDYVQWRRKASANVLSSAGQRDPMSVAPREEVVRS